MWFSGSENFRLIIGYEINLCIENNTAILTAKRYNAIGEK
nr:MAG TPA: hypothetical protein [Caudoviricetes sp.]